MVQGEVMLLANAIRLSVDALPRSQSLPSRIAVSRLLTSDQDEKTRELGLRRPSARPRHIHEHCRGSRHRRISGGIAKSDLC
jgi:hypothetical protein